MSFEEITENTKKGLVSVFLAATMHAPVAGAGITPPSLGEQPQPSATQKENVSRGASPVFCKHPFSRASAQCKDVWEERDREKDAARKLQEQSAPVDRSVNMERPMIKTEGGERPLILPPGMGN